MPSGLGDDITVFGAEIVENKYINGVGVILFDRPITKIGESAFERCSSLISVYCKAVTPPAGDFCMFNSNASGRKIYVPTESVEAYKSASYWSDYADAIVGYDF